MLRQRTVNYGISMVLQDRLCCLLDGKALSLWPFLDMIASASACHAQLYIHILICPNHTLSAPSLFFHSPQLTFECRCLETRKLVGHFLKVKMNQLEKSLALWVVVSHYDQCPAHWVISHWHVCCFIGKLNSFYKQHWMNCCLTRFAKVITEWSKHRADIFLHNI